MYLKQMRIKYSVGILIVLMLAACSGGGGGSQSGDGDDGQDGGLPVGPQPVVFIANNSSLSLTAVYAVIDDASLAPVRLDTGLDLEPNSPLPRDFEVSPNHQWVLIFVADVSGGGARAYIASIDGSIFNQVLVDTGTLEDYQWSPTGDALVYTADLDLPGIHEVYLVTAEDGSVTKINSPVTSMSNIDYESPLWSPDGRYVLFQERSLASGEIQSFEVYDTQNPSVVPLEVTADVPKPMELVLDIGWSPDSTIVTFVYDSTTLPTRELWANLVDGSGSIQINPDPTGTGTGVVTYSWAPDSTQIAYISRQRNTQNPEVYVVDADGSSPTIQHTPFSDLTNRGARDIQWSPNGEYLAYTSNHGVGFASYQLYVVTNRTDNRDAAVLQTNASGSIIRWEWMPDSSGIVYLGTSFGSVPQLYIKEPLELHSPTSAPMQEDQLSSLGTNIREDVREFSISPDNVHVAYTQLNTSTGIFELRVNPIGGVFADIASADVDIFQWSPAGDRIMFTIPSPGGGTSGTRVSDPDGANFRSLNGGGVGLTVLVGGIGKASY